MADITVREMDGLRQEVKVKLDRLAKYKARCAICGKPAYFSAQMHEIVCPPMGGSKYHPTNRELAAAVYVKQNCILLCVGCNMNKANSMRAEFIRIQMERYGPWNVVRKLRVLTRLLWTPESFVDRTITFQGRDYRVLRLKDRKEN